MKPPRLRPPADLPAADARIPGVTVRLAFVALSVGLAVVDYRLTVWVAVASILAVAAARTPQYLLGWVLILFLAAGQLARHDALSWQLLVLLAGLHLLHVLGTFTLELPGGSWVQPQVFVPSLIRFVVIQLPTQLLAVVLLLLLAPNSSGHRPLTVGAVAVVGVGALLGLALLLRPRPAAG